MCTRDNYDVFAGGKTGVLKGIRIEQKDCVVKNLQNLVSLTDNDEITTVSWGDQNEQEILIGCGVKGVRSVKLYDTESSAFTCSFFCNVGKGSINGISRYDDAILTAVHSGEVKLWRFEEEEDNEILINAGEKLNRMRHSKLDKKIIATGGEEHPLKLFDLERQKQIFTEKNVPNDWLQLKVPICISDIGFLPGTEHVVTAGRYGHVRLYDPKSQRRPVINLEVKDEAITVLSVAPREKQIVVGSGKGRMNLVDLRKPGKILNTYKGFVGGVTGIECSANEPYIVSVSLDRYLRIHHMDTKKLLKKIYLTSKVTCMLLRSEFSFKTETDADPKHVHTGNLAKTVEEDHSDAEYDTLFDEMQVVGSKGDRILSEKKRRKDKEDSLSDNEIISKNSVGKRNGKHERSSKKLKRAVVNLT